MPSTAPLAKGEESTAWADAKNEIIVALREGKIQASGIRVGTMLRTEFCALEWPIRSLSSTRITPWRLIAKGYTSRSGKSSHSTEKRFWPIDQKSKCNL